MQCEHLHHIQFQRTKIHGNIMFNPPHKQFIALRDINPHLCHAYIRMLQWTTYATDIGVTADLCKRVIKYRTTLYYSAFSGPLHEVRIITLAALRR